MARSLKVHGKKVGFKIFGNVRIPNKFVPWLIRKPFSMYLSFNVDDSVPYEDRVVNSDLEGRGAIIRSRTIAFGEYSTSTFNEFVSGTIGRPEAEFTTVEGALNDTKHWPYTSGWIQSFNEGYSFDYSVFAPTTASAAYYVYEMLHTFNSGSNVYDSEFSASVTLLSSASFTSTLIHTFNTSSIDIAENLVSSQSFTDFSV